MSRRWVLSAALGAMVAACAPTRPGDVLVQLYANPAKDEWPAEFKELSADVQAMYRYAVVNESTLKWFPCYCGCVAAGHRSNFDCYVREVLPDGRVRLDTMSFGWDICTGITRDVIDGRAEGKSLRTIRAAVDAKWSGRGPGTNTPLPPE